MADISEELLKKIWDTFEKELANNNKMKAILKKVEDGSATYIEANDYSYYAGEAIAKAIKMNISEDDLPDGIMSKDIAEKILRPMFSKDYDLVSDVCLQVQEALNESAGIGIKAIKPSFPNDRMMGIADYVSQEKYIKREKSLLENTVNAIQSISEDSVKKNAEFQYKSGLTPMIVRTLRGKACDFCESRARKYAYPLKNNEVYRRHTNCRCTVEFIPAGSKKRQNVHTKQWDSSKKGLELEKKIEYSKSPAQKETLKEIYDRNVNDGWISPLSTFENYLELHQRIEEEIVGITTTNDIVITGQTEHFLQRVIGTMNDPITGKKREGVTIEEIKHALENGKALPKRYDEENNRYSQVIRSENCSVSVNPEDGILIQCNRRRI